MRSESKKVAEQSQFGDRPWPGFVLKKGSGIHRFECACRLSAWHKTGGRGSVPFPSLAYNVLSRWRMMQEDQNLIVT